MKRKDRQKDLWTSREEKEKKNVSSKWDGIPGDGAAACNESSNEKLIYL